MNINFFLLALTALILERILQPLFSFPFFIFPAFFVIYLLLSDSFTSDFAKIVFCSIFFDFFSNGAGSMSIIAAVIVCLSILLTRKFILINKDSIFLALSFSLIFVLEYFFILAILSKSEFKINLIPIILAETLLWSAVVLVTNRIRPKSKF